MAWTTASITSRRNPAPESSAQLPLARSHLVPGDFLLIVTEMTLLPWRHFQGGMPHRLRQDDDLVGGCRRTFATADEHLFTVIRIREGRFSEVPKNSRPIR